MAHGRKYVERQVLNTNSNNATVVFDTEPLGARDYVAYVALTGGTSATAVITVECSFDNIIWFPIPAGAITIVTWGTGKASISFELIAQFCRFRVSTPEGETSTTACILTGVV